MKSSTILISEVPTLRRAKTGRGCKKCIGLILGQGCVTTCVTNSFETSASRFNLPATCLDSAYNSNDADIAFDVICPIGFHSFTPLFGKGMLLRSLIRNLNADNPYTV